MKANWYKSKDYVPLSFHVGLSIILIIVFTGNIISQHSQINLPMALPPLDMYYIQNFSMHVHNDIE